MNNFFGKMTRDSIGADCKSAMREHTSGASPLLPISNMGRKL